MHHATALMQHALCSELTEEDLQDLWKLTSAVPFFADVQLAVQPSGTSPSCFAVFAVPT